MEWMTLDEMRKGGLAPHMEEYIRVMVMVDERGRKTASENIEMPPDGPRKPQEREKVLSWIYIHGRTSMRVERIFARFVPRGKNMQIDMMLRFPLLLALPPDAQLVNALAVDLFGRQNKSRLYFSHPEYAINLFYLKR